MLCGNKTVAQLSSSSSAVRKPIAGIYSAVSVRAQQTVMPRATG